MRTNRRGVAVLLFVVLTLGIAAQRSSDKADVAVAQTTVEGLVRDIACPIQNKDATATAFNLHCALECARKGSPLIILSKDNVIHIAISDSMPDSDQRQTLMPFVGKYVKATGKIYERTGTRAIVISQIKEMKDVHVVTDAE